MCISGKNDEMEIVNIPIENLIISNYNPRKWSEKDTQDLQNSIKEFGLIDPIIVNNSKERMNIVIGGHFRLKVVKDLGYKEIPVIYVNIQNIEKEKELNLRLNKNQGNWDYKMLADFDKEILSIAGFMENEIEFMQKEQFPDFSTSEITKDDMDKKSKELKNMFSKEREMESVMCPECGNEFEVNI